MPLGSLGTNPPPQQVGPNNAAPVNPPAANPPVANPNIQPAPPQMAVQAATPLSVATDIQLRHSQNDVQTNKSMEVKMSRLASESVAAHRTVDALLKNVIKVAEAVDGELAARTAMIQANSGEASATNAKVWSTSSFTVVGQIDTPAFQKLINDVMRDHATFKKGDTPDSDGAHAADAKGDAKSIQRDLSKVNDRANLALSDQPWTLREKGTAYFNLTNSTYFKEVMTKIKDEQNQVEQLKKNLVTAGKDPSKDAAYVAAQKKLDRFSGLVDMNRLAKLEVGTSPTRQGLQLYSGKNESNAVLTLNPDLYAGDKASLTNKNKGSLSAIQGELRAAHAPKTEENETRKDLTDKHKVWVSAEHLLKEGRLTERELRLADTNPRNRPDAPNLQAPKEDSNKPAKTPVFDADGQRILLQDQAKTLGETVVQRGNGFAVWSVPKDNAFSKDADKNHKPVVAGPSGTTDRFIGAARLLAPGVKSELGVNDHQLIELSRWVATGYLVDDNHHSMVEVSLGAANHGLKAQWGVELYTEPFSQPIQAKNFSISSDQVLQAFGEQVEVSVNRDYKFDLAFAPLEWKEKSADGKDVTKKDVEAKFLPDGRIIAKTLFKPGPNDKAV